MIHGTVITLGEQLGASSAPFRVGDHVYIDRRHFWLPWWKRAWLWLRPLFELYGLAPRRRSTAKVVDVNPETGTITLDIPLNLL